MLNVESALELLNAEVAKDIAIELPCKGSTTGKPITNKELYSIITESIKRKGDLDKLVDEILKVKCADYNIETATVLDRLLVLAQLRSVISDDITSINNVCVNPDCQNIITTTFSVSTIKAALLKMLSTISTEKTNMMSMVYKDVTIEFIFKYPSIKLLGEFDAYIKRKLSTIYRENDKTIERNIIDNLESVMLFIDKVFINSNEVQLTSIEDRLSIFGALAASDDYRVKIKKYISDIASTYTNTCKCPECGETNDILLTIQDIVK